MSCETFTETIDGHEYRVTQWPATRAWINKAKLAKYFGDAIVSLISAVDVKKQELHTDKIQKGVFQALFESSDPEEVVNFLKSCLTDGNVLCDGETLNAAKFEELFSGDTLFQVYPVLIFVLKSNYKGFPLAQKLTSLKKLLGEEA